MEDDMTPTARALVALEVIQDRPGITAEALGRRLGVTERAARRYVATLRNAEIPIESVTGPQGGYRVGRGLRLPPMVFTAAEAVGLVMAVLEGHRDAADPRDLVGAALAKILRGLPQQVAAPIRAFGVRAPSGVPAVRAAGEVPAGRPHADPATTSRLVEACTRGRRVRLTYRLGDDGDGRAARERLMDVDPWAVVLRHGYWYLLGWSHTAGDRRALRVDRVGGVETLAEPSAPPPDLDALAVLEEHLSQGWRYPVEVEIEASPRDVGRFLSGSLGRVELLGPDAADRSRLVATTSDPDWYARRLAVLPVPYRVVASPELRQATRDLAKALLSAASSRSGTRSAAKRSLHLPDSHTPGA
jgi:predicted DNA-binding transcriptional regulator YafY